MFYLPDMLLLGQGEGGGGGFSFDLLLPFVIIAVLFYFLLIRPEKKKRDQHAELINSVKVNDRVVTVGGIIGTVVNVSKSSEELTIRVDENTNTKLRVLRSAISRLGGDNESAQPESKPGS